MVSAWTTDGSFTSVLQPASVANAIPAAATRRMEKCISRMIEASELDVESDNEPAAGRCREDVGVEQLVDTRRRRAESEHFRIVALVIGLPQPEVPAAQRERCSRNARGSQQRLRHLERHADLAQPYEIRFLHVGVFHVRDTHGGTGLLADVRPKAAKPLFR